MGTKSIADLLLGRTRNRILSLLLTSPDKQFYLRELVGAAGVGVGSVQRELKLLDSLGILLRSEQGKHVYFRANRQHPLYPELSQIIKKTSGVFFELRQALHPLSAGIRVAFVFGSFAGATETSRSDVDVFVIGDVSFTAVVEALANVNATLQRQVNPVVYSVGEFRRRLRQRNHFLTTVVDGAKVFLIGDEGELAGMVSARLDRIS